MNTKIHIIFVSTVELHPSSGDWRHRADGGCHIICMCLYSLLPVSFDHTNFHAPTMRGAGNTDTQHIHGSCRSKHEHLLPTNHNTTMFDKYHVMRV